MAAPLSSADAASAPHQALHPAPGPALYPMLWRWHLLAALIVVPFVLWQSATGTLYLWAEAWIDHRHPGLRFVEPGAGPLPPGAQLAAALAAVPRTDPAASPAPGSHAGHGAPAEPSGQGRGTAGPAAGAGHAGHVGEGGHAAPSPDAALLAASSGPPVQEMILPGDPRRSTTVLFLDGQGLPYPVFVDPYTGRVLGSLGAWQWLPGISKALHGGWPLGKPGSWLLELADGWAIFMILSGFYLWWPRQRGFRGALVPRLDRGARLAMRDLHATVAVLFSAIFLFFLVSALPWTAFWGGEVLSRLQASLGQRSSAGFSPGGAPAGRMEAAIGPLDALVAEARARGLGPTLTVRLAPWPGAPLYLSNRDNPPAQDRVLHGDPATGAVRRDARRVDDPLIPRLVGFGIHVHQGDFGAWNLWMNTLFALSLVWLSATGAASWWLRKPRNGWGVPRKVALRWPPAAKGGAVAMCLVLPIFGASVLLLWAIERMLGAMRGRAAPG